MPIPHANTVEMLLENMRDVARPNLFEVELEYPNQNRDLSSLRVTQNLIKSINIPGVTLGDIELVRMERRVFIPGSVTYSECNMTIHNDVDGVTKNFIKQWLNLYVVNNRESNYGDLENFIDGRIKIYQLDGSHNRVSKTVLNKAYPKSEGDIDLSHETEDDMLSFTVTFAFSYLQYSNQAPFFRDIE